MVVLGHLLELRVLDHLEEPEADPGERTEHEQTATATSRARGASRRRSSAIAMSVCPYRSAPAPRRRQRAPRSRSAPGSSSTLERHHPDDRVADACPATPARGAEIRANPANVASPMNDHRVERRCWRRNTTNRGSGAVTMNCVPTRPARKPTSVFASPPMPMTPLDSASCTSPAAPAQPPGGRPGGQRHVDHHEHQDRRATVLPPHAATARSLQRQRERHHRAASVFTLGGLSPTPARVAAPAA